MAPASAQQKYEKVPTSSSSVQRQGATNEGEDDGIETATNNNDEIGFFRLYLMGGRLTTEQKTALAGRQQQLEQRLKAPPSGGAASSSSSAVVFRIHPESIRQLAYLAFWSMCVLAIVLTKILIPPYVIEDSDLKAVFGYNNVSISGACSLFENDYVSGRELHSLSLRSSTLFLNLLYSCRSVSIGITHLVGN